MYGAVLAIIVLYSVSGGTCDRGTSSWHVSIPISVLTAVVLMYFSGITLNIISHCKSGLRIQPIPFIENIYRLRGPNPERKGVSGARQVAGATWVQLR